MFLRQNLAFSEILTASGCDAATFESRLYAELRQANAEAPRGEILWRIISRPDAGPIRVGLIPFDRQAGTWLILLPAKPSLTPPDVVTGIADRRELQRELEYRFQSSRPFAAIFIDLNGFKQINDLLGHMSGDQALREIAQRIRGCLREVDLVGRFGGDEFVALVDGARKPADLEPVVQRIQQSVSAPLESVPPELPLSASIGWALSIDGYLCPADMLAAADAQMYAEKNSEK
jgi:diguanylate cyclase (GGDEF)-like protein